MTREAEYAAFWVMVMGRPPLSGEAGAYAIGKLAFIHGPRWPDAPTKEELDRVRAVVIGERGLGG